MRKLGILIFTVAFISMGMISGTMALNPQPEPPMGKLKLDRLRPVKLDSGTKMKRDFKLHQPRTVGGNGLTPIQIPGPQ